LKKYFHKFNSSFEKATRSIHWLGARKRVFRAWTGTALMFKLRQMLYPLVDDLRSFLIFGQLFMVGSLILTPLGMLGGLLSGTWIQFNNRPGRFFRSHPLTLGVAFGLPGFSTATLLFPAASQWRISIEFRMIYGSFAVFCGGVAGLFAGNQLRKLFWKRQQIGGN